MPHAHRHLALAYLLAGQPERSLAAWRRVRERLADHPELDVGVGRALAAMERREEAARCYTRGLDGPFAADAAFGLGDLARSRGLAGEAAEHYERALGIEPEFLEAHLRLAEMLAEQGRFRGAWRTLRHLDAPADGDADGELAAAKARVLHALGRRREALRGLRRLVAAQPANGEAWRRLGQHLLEIERPRAAAAVLRRARRRAPGDLDLVRLEARALGRTGRGRRAVSLLARAAHRAPDQVELHLDVAAALLARGRLGAAERALLRGLSWNAEEPALWAAAAELALEQGRLPLARARLRSALRRHRRHPQALSLLVRWLVASSEPRKACHAGRAAARVLPADDPALCAYGQALVQVGRAGEALVLLRRYVLAAPGDELGYATLAEAYEAVGEGERASAQRRLSAVLQG